MGEYQPGVFMIRKKGKIQMKRVERLGEWKAFKVEKVFEWLILLLDLWAAHFIVGFMGFQPTS